MSELRKCDICGNTTLPHRNKKISGLFWSDLKSPRNYDKRIEYSIEDVCQKCFSTMTELLQNMINDKIMEEEK